MFLIDLLSDINNWSVSDIFSLISIIIAVIGGIFAYKQWKYSNKTKRADFINQIINKLRFDKEISNAMRIIDYNPYWYNENFHNNNELEDKIDKLLSYLSYICYLKEEKHISIKEFCILEYEVYRVCASPSVQCYLWNIYHFSAAQEIKCSFQYLIDYSIENNIINSLEFLNPESKKYTKTLNF